MVACFTGALLSTCFTSACTSSGDRGRIGRLPVSVLLGGLAATGESGCEQQTGDDQSGHSSAF